MKEITDIQSYSYKFSVCTLVTNLEEYQEMISSFHQAGFNENDTEFLFVNNSISNTKDGYEAYNLFLNQAQGEYVIICHQDILLCYDDKKVLETRIEEVEKLDKNWAILSNAGVIGIKNRAVIFTEANKTKHVEGQFPAKVKSVDECFVVIKNKHRLAASANLKGFHLYATDLCIIADILGYSAYAINFNLLHKSNGNMSNGFFKSKNEFIEKYSKVLTSKYIQTTCTIMYFSNNPFFKIFYNSSFVLFFVRNFYSLKKKLKRVK